MSLRACVLAVAALSSACVMVESERVPPTSRDYEFELNANRAQAFEALLSITQSYNLAVDVLAKDSGFIQFKNTTLTPGQLDQYATYPFRKLGTTEPIKTFASWSEGSQSVGAGAVVGTVSLSVIVTELQGGSHAKMHATWSATNSRETHQVNSKGVLEREIEAALKTKLGQPTATVTVH